MKESKIKVLQDRHHRYKLRLAPKSFTPPIITKESAVKVPKERKKRYKLRLASKSHTPPPIIEKKVER